MILKVQVVFPAGAGGLTRLNGDRQEYSFYRLNKNRKYSRMGLSNHGMNNDPEISGGETREDEQQVDELMELRWGGCAARSCRPRLVHTYTQTGEYRPAHTEEREWEANK